MSDLTDESTTEWFQVRGSSVWHTIDPNPPMRWPVQVTYCGLGLNPGEHTVVGYSGGRDCQNCARAEAKRARLTGSSRGSVR